MKKVYRLLFMTDGDEGGNGFRLSFCWTSLCGGSKEKLVIRVNLENESLKDEIIDLKKVIEKWTCSKVTLDQLLSEQKTRPSVKVSPTYVIKKKIDKSPVVSKPCSDKKADSSTEQLLLTLMEEVKGLKRQTEIPSGTPPSSSQPSISKATKQKTWFGPYKHYGFKNHLFDDCYSKPKCSTCGSTNHLTKEHFEHAVVKKTLSKLKAQSPLKPSLKKAPMIPKPFKECKNTVDLMTITLTTISSTLGVKYVDYLKRSVWYLDSSCSRHMTGIKRYMHRYSKESGPKVVFGDDSLGDTEGYGSVNCNGTTFTMVAYVNGLKHNLISISQLCDANYKVLFTKTQGTIYDKNDEFVLIAPRRRYVYFIDMSSFNKEINSCFFAKSSPTVNWLWHKRLSHLNFHKDLKMENLNKVRVRELRSDNETEFKNHKLEKFCDEKGISQNFSSPCTHEQNDVAERRNKTLIEEARTMLNSAKLPKQFWGEAVNTACYKQNRSIIVKRHGKTSYDVFREISPYISYFHVFGYPIHIYNHMDHLGKFDEKADDGFFLGYSPVAKKHSSVSTS
ncbi:retrovirus-related pol polyprotein from transposon TNT 1-94 [Tanacetum coccineum]